MNQPLQNIAISSQDDSIHKSSPDLALLIPVYNRQALLERSLASLSEDIPMDVIVVDDGSEPPVHILPGYTKKKIVLIRQEINRGITSALNTGLEYIYRNKYRFIARLDAGDTCVDGRFARQKDFLLKNPSCGVVGSLVKETGSSRTIFSALSPEQMRRRLHYNCQLAHPSVMFRADIIHDHGFYDEKWVCCEDWDYWLRISSSFELINLPEVLTILDADPQSITRKLDPAIRRHNHLRRLRLVMHHFDSQYAESFYGLARWILVVLANYIIPQCILYRIRTRI